MSNDESSLSSEDNNFADFTITSTQSEQLPSATKVHSYFQLQSQPTGQSIKRAKSFSSFVINPQRKNSIIIAATGQKIERNYSFWSESRLPDFNAIPSNATMNSQELSSASLFGKIKKYCISLITKPIIKASFTYFLASLAVYSPTISNLLGTSDSKHLVCTVVVYFHASRSVGSMIQALLFVSMALFFGIGISVGTMFFASLYTKEVESINPNNLLNSADYATQEFVIRDKQSQTPLSIFFMLLICSTSLGLVSFFKHRVSKQTFNTACSLTAILLISCLIKESSQPYGSSNDQLVPWNKIISSISCVVCGCLISVFICFTIWKEWAIYGLIKSLNTVEKNIGSLLGLLCDGFIKTDDDDQESKLKIDQILSDLKTELSKLDGKLEESMFECFSRGKEKEWNLLNDLAECERRLVVNIGNLRRAVRLKWSLIDDFTKFDDINLNNDENKTNNEVETENYNKNSVKNKNKNTLNVVLEEENEIIEENQLQNNAVVEPKELFDLFVFHLGPSTKSFIFTLNQILDDDLFDRNGKVKTIVRQYLKSLRLASDLYEVHQSKAIDSLYRQETFSKDCDYNGKIAQEEIAAICANFSFSLIQLSNEMEKFLMTLNELLDYHTGEPIFSFQFFKFWIRKDLNALRDIERDNIINIEHQTSPVTLGYKIWRFTKFLRGVDFQFGIRVGLGAFLLGMFAYFDSTKKVFSEWRGEWALVTFCIIMNKSLGGTTMTIKWRFLGTFIGAVTAYYVWVLFYPNVIIMSILGFIVSIPCFNIILNWKANNAFGRFILLTYNLTVLYSYTMSLKDTIPGDNDDWEGGANPIIFEIAFHRYIGVSVGVIWAIIVTLTLFPMSARNRIKNLLSVLWLRMGMIWKSGALTNKKEVDGSNRLVGLKGLKECHLIMRELTVLLKQAPMEMRLKGPFPTKIYKKLLVGNEIILDAFENMNSIVDIDPNLSQVESIVLENLRKEMNELENRVFLVFYMLASAMKLGFPVASNPAGTDHAMEKMLWKLSETRKTVEMRKELGKDTGLKNENFVLFYTYCLVTNSVVTELESLMQEVVELYGSIEEDTFEIL